MIGITEQDAILWDSFQQTMQQWHGLEWEFTPLFTTCNFMDLTMKITTSGHLTTTLYEKKPLPLHPSPLSPPAWHALWSHPQQHPSNPSPMLLSARHSEKFLPILHSSNMQRLYHYATSTTLQICPPEGSSFQPHNHP
jgi:hypothetical protein